MNLADRVNQEALDLWNRTFKENENVFLPFIYPEIKKSVLLFIGLNPSFTLKGFKQVLKNTEYSKLKVEEFFHWKNKENFDLRKAQEIENLFREKYPFFHKIIEISKDTGIGWEHIDLFFYRETSQEEFLRKIYKKRILTDFGKEQLDIAKRLIIEVNPFMIVVTNAKSSEIIQNEFELTFNEEMGYHEIYLNNRIIPTFLGSMLTGQRAMDIYSFQRLKWQIKRSIVILK